MKLKKKIGITLSAILLVYVASYAVLSACGGYVVTQSGRMRLAISMDDQFIWMPRYGWAQPYQWPDGRNSVRVWGFAGWLYLPIILADQACVHPTKRFMTADWKQVDGFVPPSTNSWHPDMFNTEED